MALTRRLLVQCAAMAQWGWALAPVQAAAAKTTGRGVAGATAVLAAAWQLADRYRVGWLALREGKPATEIAAIDVPTRAHHVGVDAAGRLLAVARRPGDWMLRWARPGSAPQWQWIEATRSFNGHSLTSPDGQRVFTTETDLDTGAGLIGVRHAATLAKLAEWPTGGTDPHQLLFDPQSPDALFVANGGITTRPETGRVKHALDRMDSSLVRLDVRSGERAGQWRLDDPRLSLRHLAWQGSQLGVALQAEHDAADARAAAPVLAVFDGRELRAAASPAPVPMSLAGYGGDITASADGFIVSCPRAGGLAHFDAHGAWQAFTPLPQACALARGAQGHALAAGEPQGTLLGGDRPFTFELGPVRLDNHWTWTSLSTGHGQRGRA